MKIELICINLSQIKFFKLTFMGNNWALIGFDEKRIPYELGLIKG